MPLTQDKEYTIPEVMRRLGISWLTIQRRIKSGRLRARKEGGQWWISESDLQAYIRSTYNRPEE